MDGEKESEGEGGWVCMGGGFAFGMGKPGLVVTSGTLIFISFYFNILFPINK